MCVTICVAVCVAVCEILECRPSLTEKKILLVGLWFGVVEFDVEFGVAIRV